MFNTYCHTVIQLDWGLEIQDHWIGESGYVV